MASSSAASALFLARRASPVPLGTLRFAAVTSAASLGALYLAFVLQLESPYWAATTVLIVAQPVPGQVVGKGFYRALGTITGAVVGTGLVAAFAQQGPLFIAGMALWIALCTAVSTLLRGFRSYGAVLAGYTAAIVAFAGAAAPDTTFDIALARASAILLGIVCAALAAALLLPGRSRADLLARLDGTVGGARDLLDAVVAGRPGRALRGALARDIVAVEAMTEAAGAEALDLRRRLGSLNEALLHLLAAVSAIRAIEDRLEVAPAADRAADLAWLRGMLPGLVDGSDRETAPARHAALAADLAHDGSAAALGRLVLLDRAVEASAEIAAARDAHAVVAGLRPPGRGVRLFFHRDPPQAARNALRAGLAVGAAGAFWIASAWSGGSSFVTNVCVACSLFATQPRPSAAAFGFMKGAALAMVAAFAVRFFVLPWLDGFPLLAFALGPFMLAGLVVSTLPGQAGPATAFNVLFLSTIAPTNLMTFDPVSFIDGGVATLAAFLVGGTIFRVVLPTDPRIAAARLGRTVVRALGHLARGDTTRARAASLAYDRVGRMLALDDDPQHAAAFVSSLGIGREIARLREAVTGAPGDVARVVRTVLADLGALVRGTDPGSLSAALGSAEAELAAMRRGRAGPDRLPVMRVEAAVAAIRDALDRHGAFYAAAGRARVS